MSVLDNVPVAGRKDYNFLTGDLSFIDEMDQEKQPMAIEERPSFGDDAPGDPHPPITNDGENDEQISVAIEETATLITETIDSGAAFGLSLISKGDVAQYKATSEQKGRMRKIVYIWCEQTGGYLPLWLQFIILIIGIYGSKIPSAIEERKLNILQAKVEEQRKQIEAYEAEKRANDLKQELARLKQADRKAKETEDGSAGS